MRKFIFYYILLLTTTLLAQVDNNTIRQNSLPSPKIIADSTNIEKFELPSPGFKYSLPSYSFYKDIIEFNQDALNYFDHQMYNPTPQSLSNDFKMYNRELLNAMKMIPGFQKKNDLGVFGEILGYTNAAAAIGLMIYHIHKYKDKY